MQQAKSLYLAGELLAAERADYPDSIDLGLTCPLCGKPVFLVKESVRQRAGKLEYISPHFSHFKADSELGKLCEARIQTREGKEFLQRLSPEARGQRLSLFNKRLWQMIAWEKDFPKNLDKWLRQNCPLAAYQQIPALIQHCWKHWQDPEERQQIKTAIPRTIELLSEQSFARVGVDVERHHRIVREAIELLQTDLNKRLQWLICEEVVDYLAQPVAKEVFAKLVKLALFDLLPQASAAGRQVHSNEIQYLVLCSIGLTRWIAALERFKAPQPGEGFKPQ